MNHKKEATSLTFSRDSEVSQDLFKLTKFMNAMRSCRSRMHVHNCLNNKGMHAYLYILIAFMHMYVFFGGCGWMDGRADGCMHDM